MFANCYKGRRVFITGHTGFKGSWLAAWLSRMGATVCGFADCVPTSPSHFEAMHLEQHVQDVRGDISDRDAVIRAMKGRCAPDLRGQHAGHPQHAGGRAPVPQCGSRGLHHLGQVLPQR